MTATASMSTADQVALFASAIWAPDDLVELRRVGHGGARSLWIIAREIGLHLMDLQGENAHGWNIYAGINPRKVIGSGNSARECDASRPCGKCHRCVKCARALWVDFDRPTLTSQDAIQLCTDAGLPSPSVGVSSGHGQHVYWLLNDAMTDMTEWRGRMLALISLLATDLSVHDEPRIMRLPGFLNVKAQPVPCVLIHCEPDRRYPLTEFPAAAEPEPVGPRTDKPNLYRANDKRVYLECLPFLNGDICGPRNNWLMVGMIGHRIDPSDNEIFAAWEEWSKQCPDKYEAGACAREWKTFKANHERTVGLGSLIYLARQRGYAGNVISKVSEKSIDDPMTSAPLTDAGNAERFAHLRRDQVRFDSAAARWRWFDGARWVLDETGRATNLAKLTARDMLRRAADLDDEGRKRVAGWALQSESRYRIDAMTGLARSEPGMSVTTDQWDSDLWAFNVANGTIDLRSGELQPHRAGDLMTKLAPVEFDPDAEAPRWLKFLNEIFAGDSTLIDYLQRLHGYALSASRDEHLLPVYHGGGANGKSTMLDAICYAMGDYADQAPPDLLTDRPGPDEHPTALADLRGKRLVVCSETERGRRLRVQLVKKLTGDATIKARYMRADYFSFRRTFALVLVTNNKPRVDEDSEAVWRRVRLIRFNVTIPPERRDKKLLEKFKSEAPGILRWLVDGCLAYQRDGLDEPTAVRMATDGYRADSNPLADFLAECCSIAPNAWASSASLRSAYERFAHERGEHPITGRDFSDALRRAGAEAKPRHAGRGWSGIGLLVNEAVEGVQA